ncbi:MAG TPA: alanine dehydrogenase [Acidimicrobiales bacterium]|nr:alanine dehydrogenase [Acidimicrobiales bacterium]
MIVGVPREVKTDENRVAMTPAGVRELVHAGHGVLVEAGAGAGSMISDERYVNAGAKIVDLAEEVWARCDLVVKVKEPIASEFAFLGIHRGQVLFTFLHLAAARGCVDALVQADNVAIAYETVRASDGSLPLLRPMSEVAGRMAPMVAATHLMRPGGGRGVLMSGVPGVPPARVVVIGGGVAGLSAATIARGMHAHVQILDKNLDLLRSIDHHFDGAVETIASNMHNLEEACLEADIVIGAVLNVGAKAPKLVSRDLASRMRYGSVLVDISVDQGGCFEATRPTTHSNPVFFEDGCVYYCVANMPGATPATSTQTLANATLPYCIELANLGWREAVRRNASLREGVNVVDGMVTCAPVAQAHGLVGNDVAKLIRGADPQVARNRG